MEAQMESAVGEFTDALGLPSSPTGGRTTPTQSYILVREDSASYSPCRRLRSSRADVFHHAWGKGESNGSATAALKPAPRSRFAFPLWLTIALSSHWAMLIPPRHQKRCNGYRHLACGAAYAVIGPSGKPSPTSRYRRHARHTSAGRADGVSEIVPQLPPEPGRGRSQSDETHSC
ncbi:hypothetical protein N7510_008219 [Penicillium lagena]|uniref:uncharacterized protein n=1 Tax=Penicillium lagena TaxID=94218 RepID=UPI00254254DC|nr:uncharacterized protein N7510_008219 [Penicillium lagena]KAJ5605438.1 hypothetical protein N7510_008219 [Penicillium lagena]